MWALSSFGRALRWQRRGGEFEPRRVHQHMMQLRPLFAIISCHKFKARRDSQRATWIPRIDSRKVDYKYFLGRSPEGSDIQPAEDEIFLDVPDDYDNLPEKVRAVMRWALEQGYAWVMKTDDDIYVIPERVLEGYDRHQYTGHPNTWSCPKHPMGYMSGFAYWLSPRAIKAVAEAELDPEVIHEDRWVGGVLHRAGVALDGGYYDRRYIVAIVHQRPIWKSLISKGAVFAQFEPGDMQFFHELFMGTKPAHPPSMEIEDKQEFVLGRPATRPVPKGKIYRLGKLTGY